jgi:DNA-binding transcriptional LysR family regulator
VTLKQLRAFVAAARYASFTEAGQFLGLSQPALTSAIKQFEEIVGVTLFDRTTRRVSLTTDGERFLPTAERLLSDFSLAVEDLHELADQRRERVGVSAVYSIATAILPQVVVDFAASNPTISIHLRDENSAGVCRQVRRNEVDFGFASRDSVDPELDYQLILRDRMGLVAARDHPLMKRKRLSWNDLEDFEYLGLGATTGPWLALNDAEGVPATVRSPRIELANIPTLEAMLISTLGVSSLPALAFPNTRIRSGLKYRPLDNPVVMRDLYIVTRKGRSMSRAAQGLRSEILRKVSDIAGRSDLVEVLI